MQLNIIGNGKGMTDTKINGKNIEIRNYGIVMPKGYKLGFVVENEEKEQVLTASDKFKEITGFDHLLEDGSTIIACVNYISKKYC